MNRLPMILLFIALPLSAAPAGLDAIWQQAVTRIESAHDYSTQYDVQSAKGQFTIDYRCIRPRDIRFQVVKGKHSGVVLLYQPAQNPDRIHAHQGIFTVWKGVNDEPDFKVGPITHSIFDLVLRDAQGTPRLTGEEVVNGHGTYVLSFANGSEVAVDKTTSDILRWRHRDPDGPVEQDFYNTHLNAGAPIQF